MLKIPIIFLIFKRPKETALVFEEIKKARPPKLFIVADGPRNADEKKLTDAARAVVEKIDWPCEVERNYSEVNLGCRQRVWSGLDWAFSKLPNETDGAIILEDDCLPEQSFFSYCEEMLERYKEDPKVMHIAGVNFQDKIVQESYYFSHIAQIWGWATWRRAWGLYDGNMASWLGLKGTEGLRSAFPNRLTYQYWSTHFQKIYEGKTDTWDIAWTYSVFKEYGLCIMPKVNLIKNIGSNDGASHKASNFSNVATSPLIFPLTHPKEMEVNEEADLFTYKKIFGVNNNLKNSTFAFAKDKLPFLFNYIKRLVK